MVDTPDARWGESGVAVVVAADCAEIEEHALLTHLDGRLPKYKRSAALRRLARTAEIRLRQGD